MTKHSTFDACPLTCSYLKCPNPQMQCNRCPFSDRMRHQATATSIRIRNSVYWYLNEKEVVVM